MRFRNVLLGVGVLFMITGICLIFVWFGAAKNPPREPQQPEQKLEVKADPPPPAVLAAAHFIPSGTLLRNGDLFWKEVGQSEITPGTLLRGQANETEFLGAISRRDFAEGEAIIASDFVKPGDKKFLSSVLKPGGRAVTIFVDAAQVNAGLVLPGDQVDVLLTQTFNADLGDNNVTKLHYKNVVGETVLHDARVIAIDQTLYRPSGGGTPATGPASEPRMPKTVTLELFGSDPVRLMVASELGKLQLAVLPIEKAEPSQGTDKRAGQAQNNGSGFNKIAYEPRQIPLFQSGSAGQTEIINGGPAEKTGPAPVWSFKVSPALAELIALAALPPPSSLPLSTGSTLENLIRRPVVPSLDSSIHTPRLLTPKSSGRSPFYIEGRQ